MIVRFWKQLLTPKSRFRENLTQLSSDNYDSGLMTAWSRPASSKVGDKK